MREPVTTKAADWVTARRQGRRLPEHELRCELCGEPSEEGVCGACLEAELSARVSFGSDA